MRSLIAVFAAVGLVSACAQATPEPAAKPKHHFADRYADWPAYEGVAIWRLYRTESGDKGRVKLAVFDSLAGKKYTPTFNQNACEIAARTMQADDKYNRTYWCEEETFGR